MNVIITYDVSGKQSSIRDSMIANGYYDSWVTEEAGKSKRYYLPSTTLWKKNITLGEAVDDLRAIVRRLSGEGEEITLIRCVAIPASPWAGITGVPH